MHIPYLILFICQFYVKNSLVKLQCWNSIYLIPRCFYSSSEWNTTQAFRALFRTSDLQVLSIFRWGKLWVVRFGLHSCLSSFSKCAKNQNDSRCLQVLKQTIQSCSRLLRGRVRIYFLRQCCIPSIKKTKQLNLL